ncbi:hypothetical protein B0T26DRAFT_124085 [Lasiosphaeria miniovina]|uniref:Ser/arg-related nuclear matrix protein n=1 Tax=Lasiosphaeria miniovina TaxID=1954250 RepID=A0AA40B3X3_9PEZI|nr:uncharacterized protein B0T26DRAFT_124085 [Lasiosphaeria miniovina]KAK0727226.1 hypothetical protein B0T26DRAFT_124085 [Lasiosphaeria miniovina]
MVEADDIQKLLQTGSWKTSTSRARSPKPPKPYEISETAPQPSRSRPTARGPRPFQPESRVKRPPPPLVEDEAASLAKEHGDSVVSGPSEEDPKHPGDVDQYPILLEVHEFNPERRFVILTGNETDGEQARDDSSLGSTNTTRPSQPPNGPGTTEYEANTCRQYVLVSPDEGPTLSKRKSHQDLPRLETNLNGPDAPIRRSNSRRDRDKVLVDQAPRDSPSRRDNVKPSEDAFLTPVYKHTAGGRDRAYWDFNSAAGRSPGRSPSAKGEPQLATSDDRRSKLSTSSQSTNQPSLHRRVSSASAPKRHARTPERPNHSVDSFPPPPADPNDGRGRGEKKSKAERPNSFIDFPPQGGYAPEDIFDFMMPGNDLPPRGERRHRSPPRGPRSSNSPPYPQSASSKLPSRSGSYRGQRQSSSREKDEDYSTDDAKNQRGSQPSRSYPRRTALEPETSSLLAPEQSRPSGSSRSKAKPSSPLPSPRASQGSLFPDASPLPIPRSPRSPRSSTFPVDKNKRYNERSISPSAIASKSPPKTKGASSAASSLASLPIPIPLNLDRNSSAERRLAPSSTASYPRQDSLDVSSPTPYWQPAPFRPAEHRATLDRPIVSLRRYSEDVQKGLVPQLPDCRWKSPNKTSSAQFLTLPRADNFNICTECYDAVFANTKYQKMLVPASRPADQLLSCNFGSSFWYRIAYLMTVKYGYSDLGLLEDIATVTGRHQPCAGPLPATRVWYSMMAPNARRSMPISSFNVCSSCSKMVLALFPNLAGAFVLLDPHAEATRDICELHFTPERKRFLEYFDLLETASDRSLSRRIEPDLLELADRIRVISLTDECRRNIPIANRKWYVMESLPEFSVCEECFDSVVWPLLEDEDCGDIPPNFYKSRQTRAIAACQLYSDRMRDVFRKACYRNDMDYLESKLKEKLKLESEIRAKYADLAKQDQNDPWVRGEMASLIRQMKDIE